METGGSNYQEGAPFLYSGYFSIYFFGDTAQVRSFHDFFHGFLDNLFGEFIMPSNCSQISLLVFNGRLTSICYSYMEYWSRVWVNLFSQSIALILFWSSMFDIIWLFDAFFFGYIVSSGSRLFYLWIHTGYKKNMFGLTPACCEFGCKLKKMCMLISIIHMMISSQVLQLR